MKKPIDREFYELKNGEHVIGIFRYMSAVKMFFNQEQNYYLSYVKQSGYTWSPVKEPTRDSSNNY